MISLVTSLLLALIPVDGQVYQEVAQEYNSAEECFEAMYDLSDVLSVEDNLWVTQQEYHIEVFNTETSDEYRIMCTEDNLVAEAA